MSDAGEIRHDDDCFVISIDIADCPMAEIPLTEVFNISTMTLILENYHVAIRESVLRQLEDTTWLSEDLVPLLTDSGFGMYQARDRNSIISLRKPALQRLIIQRLKGRPHPADIVHVPILIRFMMPAIDIPKPPGSSAASDSVHGSRSRHSRRGPPSVIDTSVHADVPPITEPPVLNDAIPVAPNANADATSEPPVAVAPMFRGQPVDTRPTGGARTTNHRRAFSESSRQRTGSPIIRFGKHGTYWGLDSNANKDAPFFGRSDFWRRVL